MNRLEVVLQYITVFLLGYLLSLILNQALMADSAEDLMAEALGKKILANRELMKVEDGFGGFLLPDFDLIVCQYEFACIHEVGHWKDEDLDWISGTIEFKEALDSFILQCEEIEDSGEGSYYCNLIRFPGVNGNDLTEEDWGGYVEVYAEMYVYDMLLGHPLPQIFVEFYK